MNFLKNRFKLKEKIFCIGRNKTGTTSVETALKEFGYRMGNQQESEKLIKNYKNYDWLSIINFCKTADAFQDVPFSWPFTWLVLHQNFPNAKFILTTREENEWYNSLINFHSKLFSDGIVPPTKKHLQKATYCYPGFLWEANRIIWKTPENDIYNKEILIEKYTAHNVSVLDYFSGNKNFIHLNVSEKNAYKKLCGFLNKKPLREVFPHCNKTSDIK